jgi:hypothetical protein
MEIPAAEKARKRSSDDSEIAAASDHHRFMDVSGMRAW